MYEVIGSKSLQSFSVASVFFSRSVLDSACSGPSLPQPSFTATHWDFLTQTETARAGIYAATAIPALHIDEAAAKQQHQQRSGPLSVHHDEDILGAGHFLPLGSSSSSSSSSPLDERRQCPRGRRQAVAGIPGHNDVVQLRLRRSGLVWNHHLHPPDRVQDTKGEVGSVAYRLWYPTWPII